MDYFTAGGTNQVSGGLPMSAALNLVMNLPQVDLHGDEPFDPDCDIMNHLFGKGPDR